MHRLFEQTPQQRSSARLIVSPRSRQLPVVEGSFVKNPAARITNERLLDSHHSCRPLPNRKFPLCVGVRANLCFLLSPCA